MSADFSRRTQLLAALLLLTVFMAGVAVGFGLQRLVRRQPRIEATVAVDMSGVLEKLDLTARQRAQVDSIFEHRAPATERTMREVAERLRTISDSLDRELRSILSPVQRARLDSLRRQPTIMRKRKLGADGTTRVDTVFPRGDSATR